ncbi:hypothetical protein [Jidongwangia harbinensis]|uniref:hypothetical protein n=1 Tax=Jidongwangia harbinensis TaxID=2878561 RepID=UPI001CDA2239|nr:hypothetical protein [Jidongwangia harbinensis]MCA2216277.1 hypothetical protein [Jidongwangia harbinensis]MCA2217012.1 hypothetical protein [Jidongwangia harbinensis]
MLGEFTTAHTPLASERVYQRTAVEYLQVPTLVLGAGLLGIAVARWLPWPGLLPLTTLTLWLGTIALYYHFTEYIGPTLGGPPEVVQPRTWLALWPVWFASNQGILPRQPLGQEMWHLAYLLGLGALAGTAAVLRTDGPRRSVWAAAAGIAAQPSPAGCNSAEGPPTGSSIRACLQHAHHCLRPAVTKNHPAVAADSLVDGIGSRRSAAWPSVVNSDQGNDARTPSM